MQNARIFNSLVLNNLDLIKFPDDLKFLVHHIKIPSDYVWISEGFPMSDAVYSLSGDQLYFESLPDGTIEIKQEDFTGTANIASNYILNPNDSGNHYIVGFKLIFLKGKLIESIHTMTFIKPIEEYNQERTKLLDNIRNVVKRENSFLFRWVYNPYKSLVRELGRFLLFLIILSHKFVRWLVLFLTPW